MRKIGVDILSLVRVALDLHDYQYNGFEPDFSRYSRKEDVFTDKTNDKPRPSGRGKVFKIF
ncbi:MAG: hypothetical protein QXL96_10255 [Ignisphaera sp.]